MRRIGVLIIATALSLCTYAATDSLRTDKPVYRLAYRLSGSAGTFMRDGKVDEWIGSRPLLGGSFAVEFLPTGRWHCLQQWNNASIGVGVSYLNLGNEAKLGSAFAAYGYMNQPFYNGTHFRIGLRPTVGLAAVTKTYASTYEGPNLYSTHEGANWSIGSVLNAYLAMELYMDFPIKNGWEITANGGWRHISNGSVMHPNAGYNMFGGELGVRYRPATETTPKDGENAKRMTAKELHEEVEKPWSVEISATGAVKQNYYRDNYPKMQFWGAASVQVAAYWVPLSIFRLGAGLDAYYDGYYASVSHAVPGAEAAYPNASVTYFGKTYLKESKIENCFRLGFSIQPEVIIGRLTGGIHVGFYLYDPVKNLEPFAEAKAADEAGTALNRGLFYTYDWTKASNYQDGWCYIHFILKYHVLDHLFVQAGLKTHGVRAEFIDAGIGVAF